MDRVLVGGPDLDPPGRTMLLQQFCVTLIKSVPEDKLSGNRFHKLFLF